MEKVENIHGANINQKSWNIRKSRHLNKNIVRKRETLLSNERVKSPRTRGNPRGVGTELESFKIHGTKAAGNEKKNRQIYNYGWRLKNSSIRN